MNSRNALRVELIIAIMVLSASAVFAASYATINSVISQQMSNGVQITIKSDGILNWAYDSDMQWGGDGTSRIMLRFPGAKSSMENFIDVSAFPVSYIQTSVPQDAKEGIGISLAVGLFVPSHCTVNSSADRQSVIITVNSDRTLDKSNRNVESDSGNHTKNLTCVCDCGLVSINCVKSGMLQVCGEIARVSGLNVVVDDAVASRVVSMSMDKAPAEEVLKVIASAYGLAMAKRGDVYMISEGVPKDLATYQLSGTASFPMKYVRAQTASGLLPTFLYSYLHVNSEQNAIVVSAPTQMLEKIGTDLAKVDIAPPQIMIDALAVEVSSGDDLDIALGAYKTWQHGQFAIDSVDGFINYTTLPTFDAVNQFLGHIKALVAVNRAKIHANPRMAVLNGHSADIFIGAQRFIRVEYSSAYGDKVQRIKAVDVGTKLTVTPWTGGNGEITTKIAPEVSNIVELDRLTGLPTLSSRVASTTVRVKDGETIVIGGLTTKQDYNTRRKVPLLGDIPLVGRLFQSKSKTSAETELVILITPRILDESGRLPANEERDIRERMLEQQLTD